jgi:hypothetical protein
MTRLRVASALAVVAVLAVLGGSAVAWWSRDDQAGPHADDPPDMLTVRDPATGASFVVPAGGWRVQDRSVRIYYTDARGRPVAVVRGPAVFRPGYCSARPRGSNRAFAGFTRDSFAAWVGALSAEGGQRTTGVDRRAVELADGTPARLSRVGLFVGERGACAAAAVEVAMVEAGGVRVVLVRDDAERGALAGDQVEPVLRSLVLRAS